jgi:hypothetical protein
VTISTGTKIMKALRIAEFGPPSVLRFEEISILEPREGEALIHLKPAAINPSDVGNVAGRFKNTTLPRTPGRDFAGIVVKGKQHEGQKVWGRCSSLGIIHDGSPPSSAQDLRPACLQPPPVETVPFEKVVDAYSRVAARQTKTKQVLGFG